MSPADHKEILTETWGGNDTGNQVKMLQKLVLDRVSAAVETRRAGSGS